MVTELRRKEKLTVFLTTHYMEEAADADYVILLGQRPGSSARARRWH